MQNNYNTTPKVRRIYVKEANVPKPQVKSLLVFFLSLHIFFGIDYGFAGSFRTKTKHILRAYSTLFSIFMFIVIIYPYNILYYQFWYWLTSFECLFYVIVLKRAKYSVYNFITDMQNFNDISAVNESFGIYVSLYSYSMFISKLFLIFFRCIYTSTSNCAEYEPGVHELYAILSNALDFIPISAIVIYYLTYCAVADMKETLEKDCDVSKFLTLYTTLANCCDKIRPLYDNIVSMYIIYN